MGRGVCRRHAHAPRSGMIRDMSTPSATEKMFTAAGAAKACKVGRSTVHRYLEQGRLPGAERDADGVWQIPLSALLSVGWTPGRSPSVVDTDHGHDRDSARDSDRGVSLEVHELTLELERARAEARAQSAKVDALERVLALYERQLEAAPPKQAPIAPQTPPAPVSDPTPAPEPVRPSQANVGRFRRAWNVVRFG